MISKVYLENVRCKEEASMYPPLHLRNITNTSGVPNPTHSPSLLGSNHSPGLLVYYPLAFLCNFIPDRSAGKKIRLPCRRPWFSSWVGEILWRRRRLPTPVFLGLPGRSAGKESACNAGDHGSIPGSGRSSGEGIGYPLQYSWASLVAQLVKESPAV